MIDKELLRQMIEEKMVKVETHPDYELYIYNYTPKCVFAHCWNDVTMQCRGLILDKDMNVVALPLRKFFNYEELDRGLIPDLPFKAYEKIDGSMWFVYIGQKSSLLVMPCRRKTQSLLSYVIQLVSSRHCRRKRMNNLRLRA